MNNKKKLIIGGCAVALFLVMILLATNLGTKLKYDLKARKAAEWIKKDEAIDSPNVKIGKLKYMYTFYNSESDTYKITYYTKWIDEETSWYFVTIELNGSTWEIEKTIVYNDFVGEKEKFIKKDIETNREFKDDYGIWERADRLSNQNTINSILLLALIAILVTILYFNKNERYFSAEKDNKALKDNNNSISRMEEIVEMLNKGLISDEEFQAKKKDILDKV